MALRIDSHHHFWRYVPEQFGWIGEEQIVLQRDFLPGDLESELSCAGIDLAIAVQARQSLEETEFLLDLASEAASCGGVVGWVPLADPGLLSHLDRFAAYAAFRGVRHVLQDEPDPEFCLRPDFDAGISELKKYGLVYDILIRHQQLSAAIRLVDRHPEQAFVLDHLAKPPIRQGEMEPWAAQLRELARRENVSCKLSGMVTEAGALDGSGDKLRPYFEVALEVFGSKRLLFGSDWPVCLTAAGYQDWLSMSERLIEPLSPSEKEDVMGNNACAIYKLGARPSFELE